MSNYNYNNESENFNNNIEDSYRQPENNEYYTSNTTPEMDNFQQQANKNRRPPSENYPQYKSVLIQSIIQIVISLCCCMGFISTILAIVSLIMNSEANNRFKQGLHLESEEKYKVAKILLIIGWILIGLSIIAAITYYIVFVTGILMDKTLY